MKWEEVIFWVGWGEYWLRVFLAAPKVRFGSLGCSEIGVRSLAIFGVDRLNAHIDLRKSAQLDGRQLSSFHTGVDG